MLKRLLSLLVLTTLGCGSLRAQESAASQSFKQRLRGQYLHNDTAQAIITLYARRQGGGASWVVASMLTAARVATAGNTTTTGSSYGGGTVTRDDGNNAGLAFLFALPIAGYGVGKIVHYSNGKLEHLLTDYAAGKPLPRSVRRKLKPRFFAQSIIQYQPVKAQPVK